MKKLEGKVAVVTGGNSGIGLATARKFAEHGAKVIISGRDPKTLEKAARDIGGDTLALRADVAEPAELESLFDKEMAQGLLGRVPAKRFERPGDVAEAVLFLASSDSAYVVGVEINVDGGMGQL
jgi:NAD(P)-dependent dehydrogenase (short-subunit alcohol dehydrogenase family)